MVDGIRSVRSSINFVCVFVLLVSPVLSHTSGKGEETKKSKADAKKRKRKVKQTKEKETQRKDLMYVMQYARERNEY